VLEALGALPLLARRLKPIPLRGAPVVGICSGIVTGFTRPALSGCRRGRENEGNQSPPSTELRGMTAVTEISTIASGS
jgi:hypothetical protein